LSTKQIYDLIFFQNTFIITKIAQNTPKMYQNMPPKRPNNDTLPKYDTSATLRPK
jgi:hypothetical protein